MTKKWQKFLLKSESKTRSEIEKAITKILSKDFRNLDIKSLQGKSGYFRCRIGKIRIIYFFSGEEILIDEIGYRGDIYK